MERNTWKFYREQDTLDVNSIGAKINYSYDEYHSPKRSIWACLTSKLDNALLQIDKENDSTINILEAFINQVEALRGKKLTDEQVDKLIFLAQNIIAALRGTSKPAI